MPLSIINQNSRHMPLGLLIIIGSGVSLWVTYVSVRCMLRQISYTSQDHGNQDESDIDPKQLEEEQHLQQQTKNPDSHHRKRVSFDVPPEQVEKKRDQRRTQFELRFYQAFWQRRSYLQDLTIFFKVPIPIRDNRIDKANHHICQQLCLQYIGDSKKEIDAAIESRLKAVEQFLIATNQYRTNINTYCHEKISEFSSPINISVPPEDQQAILQAVYLKMDDLEITNKIYYSYSQQLQHDNPISDEQLWETVSMRFISLIHKHVISIVKEQIKNYSLRSSDTITRKSVYRQVSP